MSRIGKKSVSLPAGVTASVSGQNVSVKGPKGELKVLLTDQVIAKLEGGSIDVKPRDDTKLALVVLGHVTHHGCTTWSPA